MSRLVSLLLLLCVFTPLNTLALNVDVQTVCFSPAGHCHAIIIQSIDKARSTIRIMAYSFTNARIAKALITAKRRGVSVEIVIDKSRVTERYSEVSFMSNHGIPCFVDAHEKIQHNKVMIIDNEIVITGSYNFTKAATEYNAENLLIIASKELAKLYVEDFNKHKAHAAAK